MNTFMFSQPVSSQIDGRVREVVVGEVFGDQVEEVGFGDLTKKPLVPKPKRALDTRGYILADECHGEIVVHEFGFGDPIATRDFPITTDFLRSVPRTRDGFKLAGPAEAFAVFLGANRPLEHQGDWQIPGVFTESSPQFFLCPGVLGEMTVPQQRREEVTEPLLDGKGRTVMYMDGGKFKPQMKRWTRVTDLPPLCVRAFMFLYLMPGVSHDMLSKYDGPKSVWYGWWPVGEGSFPGKETTPLYVR